MVAQACGLRLGDGDCDVTVLLPRVLAGQRCLLVLFNCEHLAAAVGALLQPGLDRAPGARLLVASQVALHLPCEQVWRLVGLCMPPDGASLWQAQACSALPHFEQRAVACDHRFALDAAVLRCCRWPPPCAAISTATRWR